MLRATCLFVAFLSTPALAQDSVWVVDSAGGGDFLEIADALPFTEQGWTIVVRPGVYTEPVVIANQGLTLVADGGGSITLTAPLAVQDTSLARNVTLSGLILEAGLEVLDCDGLVRVQDGYASPTGGAEAPPGTRFWQW